jgi:hypothetical protein
MKRTMFLSALALVGCFVLGWTNSQRVLQSLHYGPVDVKAHVQWGSPAGTVAQQVEEADIIIRGHVVKLFPPKVFEKPLPGNEADRRFPPKFDVIAFTEALVKVDKVYLGNVPGTIRVIQTGGEVAENDNHPDLLLEVGDDPLLEVGKEHVLFLQEVTGDPVLAPNHIVYRIVNSAGRYDIDGNKAVSHSTISGQRPTRLSDLRQQIRRATRR